MKNQKTFVKVARPVSEQEIMGLALSCTQTQTMQRITRKLNK
jgi:hypothetical protein